MKRGCGRVNPPAGISRGTVTHQPTYRGKTVSRERCDTAGSTGDSLFEAEAFPLLDRSSCRCFGVAAVPKCGGSWDMGAKYLPSIKDQKANQRFQQQQKRAGKAGVAPVKPAKPGKQK